MAVQGVFASDSGIQGDPKGDFAAALLQEVPTGTAPFFALSSGMQSEPATETIIHWFEEAHLAGRTTLTEPIDATETGFDVADASMYVPGTILMVETTGEYVLITSISGNTITVVRAFGSVAASAAALSGDGIQRIATSYEEGSPKPVALANQGYARYNYTQLFRNTWNITGTAQAVEYYTGSKAAKTRRDASLFHAEDIERALWWGQKTVNVVSGTRMSTMDGMDAMVTTNVFPAGATTDWVEIDDFLRKVFEKNIKGKPNERVAFCGNTALQVINGVARIEGQIFLNPGATKFGINVNYWVCPYGTISLLTHPLMNESPLWTKDLRIFHPGAVTIKWLRRTFEDTYDRDGTRAGVDADFGVFTSELSFKYTLERTAGRLTGMTAAVAVP